MRSIVICQWSWLWGKSMSLSRFPCQTLFVCTLNIWLSYHWPGRSMCTYIYLPVTFFFWNLMVIVWSAMFPLGDRYLGRSAVHYLRYLLLQSVNLTVHHRFYYLVLSFFISCILLSLNNQNYCRASYISALWLWRFLQSE